MTALACPAPDLSAVLDGTDDRLARWFLARRGVRRSAPDYADALQACRMGLIEAARRYVAEAGAKWITYAVRVMRNWFCNWLRAERRRGLSGRGGRKAGGERPLAVGGADRLAAFDSLAARDARPDDAAAAAELWDTVARHLPERQRSAILLRYRDGLSISEVGDRLGTSKQWASQLISDGLFALRHHLAGQH